MFEFRPSGVSASSARFFVSSAFFLVTKILRSQDRECRDSSRKISPRTRSTPMNKTCALIPSVLITCFCLVFATPLVAQPISGIQMAELTEKLHLTDQQQKELAPAVEQRDREIEALKANTSMSKIQKLRKLSEI